MNEVGTVSIRCVVDPMGTYALASRVLYFVRYTARFVRLFPVPVRRRRRLKIAEMESVCRYVWWFFGTPAYFGTNCRNAKRL